MSEIDTGWALDPWSNETEWIPIPALLHEVKLPRPGASGEIVTLRRHTYTFQWLAPEVFFLYGETRRIRPMLENLDIAIMFCTWIKRMVVPS